MENSMKFKKGGGYEIKRMIIASLVFIFSNLLTANLSVADDWKALAESDTAYILYHQKTISNPSPGIIRIWTRTIPKSREEREKEIEEMRKAGMKVEDYDHSIILFEINCPGNKSRPISVIDYDNSGKILNQTNNDSAKWDPIPPDSALLKLALSYLPKTETSQVYSKPDVTENPNIPTANKSNEVKKEPIDSGNQTAWADLIFNRYTLLAWLIIVIVGIILGYKKQITVFRDYNDLAIVFAILFSPFVLVKIMGLFAFLPEKVLAWLLIISYAALISWVIIRSFKDNQSIIKSIIAIITKLTLSILFIINLISIIEPSGKTAAQRESSRRWALLFLAILTPIIISLVRTQEGFLNAGKLVERPRMR